MGRWWAKYIKGGRLGRPPFPFQADECAFLYDSSLHGGAYDEEVLGGDV